MEEKRDMPLSGIKVLELATVVAAPSACELLCAYGAEVIKIEPPNKGDALRYGGRQLNVPIGDNKNPIFTLHNNGKRFAAINIQRPDGKKAFFKLLEEADVFVTNMRIEPIKRLELDYESLKERFPRLIYADLTGFGKTGPDSRRRGYDTTAFWLRSGAVSEWQEGDNVPFYPAYGFGDIATGMFLFSGILMGLLARERTGRGTEITTSLFASSIWCNGNNLIRSQFNSDLKPDYKNPGCMLNNYYRCSDGKWIFMCSMNYKKDYKKISRLLGLDDICDDPRYTDHNTLHSSGVLPEAVERYAAVFATQSSEHWKKLLNKNDVAFEIVGHINDICTDKQAIKNNYITEVEFADNTKVMMPLPPLQFSAYESRDYVRTGPIGYDTESVLADAGYTEEDIHYLRDKKSI